MRIVLFGADGRLGKLCTPALTSLGMVERGPRLSIEDGNFSLGLGVGVLGEADVVVNLAGRAHLPRDANDRQLSELVESNVLLPAALAEACLSSGSHLVHVSSRKSSSSSNDPYSYSKRFGDAGLAMYGGRFEEAGASLVILQPPAILVPPYNAGKLAQLRHLTGVPSGLLPDLKLPAISAESFSQRLCQVVRGLDRQPDPGVRIESWSRSEYLGLRTIVGAIRASTEELGQPGEDAANQRVHR